MIYIMTLTKYLTVITSLYKCRTHEIDNLIGLGLLLLFPQLEIFICYYILYCLT